MMQMVASYLTAVGELKALRFIWVPADTCELLLPDFGRSIEALGWGKVVVLKCLPMI